jgi:hypothetical protein
MNGFLARTSMNEYKSLAALFISTVLALLMLNLYDERRIQADDFALGKENTSRSESMDGVPFTGHSMAEIKSIVNHYATESKRQKVVLWLGNSQLHTLNQFKQGEHLAPYWVRKYTECGSCFVPLGLSLSNASPQEEFVLSQFVESKLALSALVLQVEFMGFRESGLRKEFSQIATDEFVDTLRAYPLGSELAKLAAEAGKNDKSNDAPDSQDTQDVEGYLSEKLGSVWPLWKNRGNLRSNVLGDLFTIRNWTFNISSASQRKIIKPRYDKNMRSLEDLLARSKAANVPVIMYISPVRQDKPLPYDNEEYAHWKSQVEQLANTYSAKYLNFEKLIPGENWGSNFGEDIDFMHFQEPGHKILAKVLLPVIQARMK